VVKVGYHGPGPEIHPEEDPRVVTEFEIQRLRGFLAETFPTLAQAPITYTRRCLYSDTIDEHFILAEHPDHAGLVVAAGDSGHGFKFAPVLGPLIADVVEGEPNAWAPLFRWRTLAGGTHIEEASRFQG
jgi:glycine/D-amino acid oxidase-like deaminating enzyme